ncbi:lysophospholipid acyltransferase family protein [Acinetobacter nectaris]|nr:lysophospholipid acyltransferase family protein [Acinetobacter nectaris]MCF9033894.1 1-acyl-sn-glycerol-3-phosphate acyltransferase [Acinetobacter nectaris]
MEQKINTVIKSSKSRLGQAFHYAKKIGSGVSAIGEGFYVVYKNQLYKSPNNPENTQYVQWFCRRMCKVFNVDVQVHGEQQHHAALWASNHVSWLDIPVLGSSARVFFLAKAEIEQWPIFGKLAKSGGTLFIKRGSGDSSKIKEQITDFLKNDVPVLFFPEATTSDGTHIQRIHGRILGAAVDAQKPIQVALICYVNQDGTLDKTTPYVGKISLAEHLKKVVEMPKVTAHVMFLPEIDVAGHTVETLTKKVQVVMKEGLLHLHQQVLKK